LDKPSGDAFSNPFASELARDSENTSLISSADNPSSLPATSHPQPDTAPEAQALDSGRSTLAPLPRLRGAVFARLQNWKGAEVLCEALRLVPEVSVEWYGRTVTGTDGKRSYAEELEEKFPDIFGNQLLHRGEVSHEEASRAMRSVDFVCVPSLWDVFNLTVVEAMQQGAVVICSRQAGAEMLVADGRNAFLFDPSSPKSLVELLRHIAGLSIERREEIGNAARQTILENLDLASLTEARMCFYRSILDASPSPAASSFLKSLCNFPESPIRKRRTIRSKVATILQRLPVFQARGGN
jgi:glycosyltransferase involved in cell wall biosynthesis